MTKKKAKKATTVTAREKKNIVTDFDRLIYDADFEGVRDGALPYIEELLKKIPAKSRPAVRRGLLNALYRAIIAYAKNKLDRSRDGNFLLHYSSYVRDVLGEARD
ncbi:MAG: hypothetical protein KBE09_04250 [Candidatus Pacebacteria bacterium]|nr:hypothetical protein [Candidatus Paceibacterota bacterium]